MEAETSPALERTQVVLDSNVVINWIASTHPYHSQAQQLLEDCNAALVLLTVPPTFHTEVDSVIRLAVHKGLVTKEAGQFAYTLIDALPVVTASGTDTRKRAREIAEELSQPRVYDATYLALAEDLKCEFWTADQRFYNVANSRYDRVKFLGDYHGGEREQAL